MRAIAEANDAQWQSNRPAAKAAAKIRRGSGRRATPKFVAPMRCKPVTTLPAEGDWTYEVKFDGYRCIALKSGGEVTLFSRNENVLNERFPNVVDALGLLEGDFVLDGEIVALDEQGRPSFQLLQNNRRGARPVFLYAFDLLHRDGASLHQFPIEERRERLHDLLRAPVDPIRLSPLLQAPQGKVLEAVRKLGLEGVVGKRDRSVYEPGERSGAWIKHRTAREQEFVIGGYTPGAGGFDALLVGVREGKDFVFVAKVKNGFVPRTREELSAKLKKLRALRCPFVNLPEKKGARRGEALTAEAMKKCRWVKPTLVCRIAFVEWTDAGHLRHCNFVAMRDDKNADEVTRET
jgi:bifunctional non-homologous end joining protein LigD